MSKKVDFIPQEWNDYRIFFDENCETINFTNYDIVKFMVADYFFLYINPTTLKIYNVSKSITKLLDLKNGMIPEHISQFIGYIHPDDFEFIEFAEKWGFEKIISSKNINKLKLTYLMRFKVSDSDYEYFHHQTYYEINPLTKKICCCIAFNTIFKDLAKDVENSERVVKILNVENLDVIDSVSFYPSMNPLLKELTVREKEIIVYITRGLTGKDIAEKLNVSYNTIRTHHSNINKKMNVKNTAELIGKCKEIGFL